MGYTFNHKQLDDNVILQEAVKGFTYDQIIHGPLFVFPKPYLPEHAFEQVYYGLQSNVRLYLEDLMEVLLTYHKYDMIREYYERIGIDKLRKVEIFKGYSDNQIWDLKDYFDFLEDVTRVDYKTDIHYLKFRFKNRKKLGEDRLTLRLELMIRVFIYDKNGEVRKEPTWCVASGSFSVRKEE